MYYNFTVQIPSIKGKVLTKDKGAATYILYQYGLDYKPDKKYAIPKRTIIGKVDPADRSRMYPNEKFQEYFRSSGQITDVSKREVPGILS